MSTWFLAASLGLCALGAVGVVAFENPTRSAGGLVTAFIGAAAAAASLGVPLVPGFFLWVGAGGIGLLLLASVLLLNISVEERGARRLRLRPALTAPLLAVLWSAVAGGALALLPEQPPNPRGVGALDAASVAGAIDALALPFALGLFALAASLVVTLALVRRTS